MNDKLPLEKAARDLKPGDRIAAGFLPCGLAGTVLHHPDAFPLPSTGEPWVMVTYRLTNTAADAEHFRADKMIPLESAADPTGLAYSRDADDPTPVSPARVPLHTGAMTDGGLVDETPGLAPAPLARHYDTSDGTSVDCACGAVFTGADADALLQRHIAEGNATSPETGERVEVGADGCGCRITEEIRPNGTSIDGTERVEHRPGCWALNVPAEDATLTPPSAE